MSHKSRKSFSLSSTTVEAFDPELEPVAGHFGLKLIRDILAEADETLLVDPVIGRGTRVELSLPGD